MKRLALGVAFLSLIWMPYSNAAGTNSNPASPTPDELLDFDSADKNVSPTPVSGAPAPEPAPVNAAPPQAQTPPAPAPEAVAPPMPPTAPSPTSLDDVQGPATPPPAQNPTAQIQTPVQAPAPAQGTQEPELIPPPPPPEVDGAPPPAEGGEPSSDLPVQGDLQPPPPEILNSEGDQPPPPAEITTPPDSQKNQPAAQESDENLSRQDAANEARFARIYQQFNSSELNDDKWSEIAGEKGADNYSLQAGDTLWDISTKFFGNGFYWPKVWELNDAITNPHLVTPGNVITFTPGTSTEAPSLAVNKNSSQELAQNDGDEDEGPEPAPEVEDFPTAQAPTGNIIIPPPKRKHPVLAKIPPSFPDYNHRSAKYDSNGFAMEVFKPVKSNFIPNAVPCIIIDRDWESDGDIVDMPGDVTVASTFQDIIVRLFKPAQKGDVFTVYSEKGTISDPVDGGSVGTAIDTRAEIQIEEAIDGSTEDYRAIILDTVLPARLGDHLRAGRHIVRVAFDRNGTPGNISARLINGQYNDRVNFALNEVVYLNRGSAEGLQVGSLLNIVRNMRLRNPNSIIKIDPRPAGILKVVQVDDHVATAAIVKEIDDVMPGDETAPYSGLNPSTDLK